MERSVAIFVDVINIHRNVKKLYGAKLDYKLYLEKAKREGRILRAFAYGAQVKDEANRFISFLRMVGFEPRYVEARKQRIYPESVINSVMNTFKLPKEDPVFRYLNERMPSEPEQVHSVTQTDRISDIVLDVARILDRVETVIIGSSNPRMLPLVKFIKERGVRVIIFSCNIPRELKDEADRWWEINDMYLEQEQNAAEEEELESEEVEA